MDKPNQQHPHRRSQPGATLIELIVTLAVAAILVSIAAPSFQDAIETNRAAAVINDLARALALTRSEAVTRGASVTICKTADPTALAPVCSSSSNWTDGWIVFLDLNADGAINSTDQVIRVGQLGISNVTIEPRGGFTNRITYYPSGTAGAGRFQVTVGSERRILRISNTGRTKTCNPDQPGVVDCGWLS